MDTLGAIGSLPLITMFSIKGEWDKPVGALGDLYCFCQVLDCNVTTSGRTMKDLKTVLGYMACPECELADRDEGLAFNYGNYLTLDSRLPQ